MVECNSTIVRRAVELVWNQGDLNLADHLFASGYVNHGGLIPDVVHGPEAIKFSVAFYRTAFPELAVTIDRMDAAGDIVELSWEAHTSSGDPSPGAVLGSHKEPFIGTTCTRLLDGQIVESWMEWESESALRHLGEAAESDLGGGCVQEMEKEMQG